MPRPKDLSHIRATLVHRIAQHNLNRDEQAKKPSSAAPRHLRDVEDSIAYWQKKADLAVTAEGRDYAIERIEKLMRSLDAWRPVGHR